MSEIWYPDTFLYPRYTTSNSDTDFIGFTFNNIHSSTYNIVRVSDGSRLSESLLPSISDTTGDRVGEDGVFFFGSKMGKRDINIQIAFDSLSETDLRNMRNWLSSKEICPLVFDERPYKVYHAKVTGSPNLTYLCFEEDNARIYKGEGALTFTAYEPYAVQDYEKVTSNGVKYKQYKKYLNNYSVINNAQWALSSGMLNTGYDCGLPLDTYQYVGTGDYSATIELYNPGDTPAPFKLFIKPSQTAGTLFNLATISIYSLSDDRLTEKSLEGQLYFNFTTSDTLPSTTSYMVLNSNNKLLEGYNSTHTRDGNIFNQYITGGQFFNIPPGKSRIKFTGTGVNNIVAIEYPYYYI